ncbi:MAG: 50S ribosomal protein L22 [Thermofilaceae archaeon]|nr:50S ribosomal protein L22 [Thermofilaceae archaeon]
MPKWGYSVELDPARTAMASGRDLKVSYKATVEILNVIRGKKLEEAKSFLNEVIQLSKPVPYKVYNKKVGHRRGMGPGRYPVKAARAVLKVLQNAEANAEYKGLDTSRLWVVHAAAHKGMKFKSYMPRAFGRATPLFRELVHVEIGLEERT